MNTALIVVDVQNDFCEGGSLAVPGGAAVAAGITELLDRVSYAAVVGTRDHHRDPGSHFSATPDYTDSWPPHCVVGTAGAELHPALAAERLDGVFNKGETAAAYSGFEGRDGAGTRLADWLREHGIDTVDVVGIATDYCVVATALDARKAGFGTRVLVDLCAGVRPESTDAALDSMRAAGITVV